MAKTRAENLDDEIVNPWAATFGCPTDQLLRVAGFKIHSRPSDSCARWSRGGQVYTEQQAIEIARQETKK